MSQFIRRTTTLAGADFTQALRSETHAPTEGAEGPCPLNEKKCSQICRAKGYKGGYCGSFANLVCKCY
ncbi:arthropod defensin [Actinomyces lilanjuaniae]|uniref:Arthropod defensin n=1 Tax=Actinomyces lilanjuaniae TaxID=2321394 RepID=A0ABM6Z1Y6_9ACTO|nr:actinodefensin [Actinomyces lilanjuaniae]AYD89229.1 arthropod defensin [Actinomyces lilanjuaniae]